MHPLEEALDADGDHQLSAKEIENAVTALKTLDKNEDGKLGVDELRPRFGGRPGGPDGDGREPGFPDARDGAGRPDGRGPGGGAAPRDGERPANNDEVLSRVLSFDKNEDGKLTKDELPERMQGMIERGDSNGDGALDKEELAKIAASFQGQGRRPDGDRPAGRGPGAPDAGPAGRGGPPNPEMMVEMAMRFDADGDGKLNREELTKFAQEMGRRRAGEGNPQGRGGRDADGGDRPGGRPQRPSGE
jgi:collagen type III alpha